MNTEQFKNQLNEMKSTLVNRINNITKDKTRQSGPLEADSSEQAISLQNNEVIDHLDDIEREELVKIDAALTRIELGTFGRCSECDASITEKRLSALPFASTCMGCMNGDN